MNQRELSEIRRRLNPEKRNPTLLRGCYVSAEGQVISTFTRSFGNMPNEENEKYMALFKRCLSGAFGQNLHLIDLTVGEGVTPQQDLLLGLQESALTDEESIATFYQRAIQHVVDLHQRMAQSVDRQQAASNYLIALLHDGYDVPARNHNDEMDREQSMNVFHYILCCVCPVKQSKPALRYDTADSDFHSRSSDWVVAAPELGFLYPAFEDGGANVNRALYYTHDPADLHTVFLQNVFGAEPGMTAPQQKETFQAILEETLAEECGLDVVQAMHETVRGMMEEQKADKKAEPLAFTPQDVKNVLTDCGVSQEKAQAFETRCAETFGAQTEIPAVNMIAPRQFHVDTPSVSIRVDPERSDLIETRIIDGKPYLLVPVDGDVEVNGMKITCR